MKSFNQFNNFLQQFYVYFIKFWILFLPGDPIPRFEFYHKKLKMIILQHSLQMKK